MQLGKQISVARERTGGGWTLNRSPFLKEKPVYNIFKSKELFDLYSESVSLIKQLLNKMDLCLKSSTTFFTAFSKIEVFLKAKYWYLNLKRKCSEDSWHGGEDINNVGICIA